MPSKISVILLPKPGLANAAANELVSSDHSTGVQPLRSSAQLALQPTVPVRSAPKSVQAGSTAGDDVSHCSPPTTAPLPPSAGVGGCRVRAPKSP